MRRADFWAFLSFIVSTVVAALPAKAARPEVWIEVRSPHFTVVSDAGQKQARRVAYRFEQIRLVFLETFPHMATDPIAPIIVLAVKNQNDFRRLEPASWDQKGALQRSGLFQMTPEKNYVLVNLSAPEEAPYHVLFHEYTHLLVHQNVGHIPLWLDEGLAEFYGYTEIHEKEIWLGSPSADHVLLLRRAPLIPLPILFRVGYQSPYYNEQDKGNMFYAESWALTHMLMIRDFRERTNLLSNYLDAVRQGADGVTAAERVFGDLGRLQNQLGEYVRQQSFSFLRMKASAKVDEQDFGSRDLTPAESDVRQGDLLVYVQRYDEAQALLNEALRMDPTSAAANVSMGFLEFQLKHNPEAEKWFTKAVELNSESYLANYYYAVMAVGEGPSAAASPRVEQSLRTAIQINPRFAPAYASLANLYANRGEDLPQAHSLALQAVSLDPANVWYYQVVANVLLRMKDPESAIRVCQDAARLAKTPAQLAAVQTELESAERYQSFLEQQKQAQEAMRAASTSAAQAAPAQTGPGIQASEMQPPVLMRRPEQHGARDESEGLIKSVTCSPPAALDLVFETRGSTLRLRTDNYFHVVFTAINFKPHGVLNPCQQIAGMKARAVFFDVKGHPGEGDLISIGLRR